MATAKSPSLTEVCVLKVLPRYLGRVLQGEELRLVVLRWMYHLTNPRQNRMRSPKKQIMGFFNPVMLISHTCSHDISVSEGGGDDFAWEPPKDVQCESWHPAHSNTLGLSQCFWLGWEQEGKANIRAGCTWLSTCLDFPRPCFEPNLGEYIQNESQASVLEQDQPKLVREVPILCVVQPSYGSHLPFCKSVSL